RTIAMDSTDGLVRGTEVKDTGGPITVPVGKGTLGRMMNVIGDPIDGKGKIESEVRLPIHRPAPPVSEQATDTEVLETGIKVIDLTLAEYFRDEFGQDVLLFIDNVFRYMLAGSEVSALLGRLPSAVGYQPTLATEMGDLEERITSTKKGSITSVQAVFVPADD